jgi:glycosyltransferase involved in cell wall biosynthesis
VNGEQARVSDRRETDLACFSRFLWRDRFTTSRHHLVRALAARYRALYVEPAPNLGRLLGSLLMDGERLRLELARPMHEPPVGVVRPWSPDLPLEGLASWPALWEAVSGRQGHRLGRLARETFAAAPGGGQRRVVCLNSFYPARAAGIVEGLRPDLVVYHCTDSVAELTRTDRPRARECLDRAELDAARSADIVVASAPPLVDRLSAVNRRSWLLPNGVDVETFLPALSPGPEPDGLPPRPRLLFVGNVEHGRREVFDVDLVEDVMRRRPAWSLVIVGHVAPANPVARRLGGLPNVTLVGARPRSMLAAYLRAADVCLIPYRLTGFTASISPLKLHEYLAAGRPVVATPFCPAVNGLRDVITVARDGDLEAAIQAVLDDPGRDQPRAVSRRVTVARDNSWAARAATLAESIDETLRARSSN